MSLEAWKKEFYPIPAGKVGKQDALMHSLRKWKGLKEENLKKHNLERHCFVEGGTAYIGEEGEGESMVINAGTCAVCFHHEDPAGCNDCPLYELRDNVRCDTNSSGESISPFDLWADEGDANEMIMHLERARVYEAVMAARDYAKGIEGAVVSITQEEISHDIARYYVNVAGVKDEDVCKVDDEIYDVIDKFGDVPVYGIVNGERSARGMNKSARSWKREAEKRVRMIFIDISGVLINFMEAACRFFDLNYEEVIRNSKSRAEQDITRSLYSSLGLNETRAVKQICDAGHEFWDTVEGYAWTDDLWKAAGSFSHARVFAVTLGRVWYKERVMALCRCLPKRHVEKFVVPQKWMLAGPGRVLIDDREPNVWEFEKSGGKGIAFPQPWNYSGGIEDDEKVEYVLRKLKEIEEGEMKREHFGVSVCG